jgi:hypothetical protein
LSPWTRRIDQRAGTGAAANARRTERIERASPAVCVGPGVSSRSGDTPRRRGSVAQPKERPCPHRPYQFIAIAGMIARSFTEQAIGRGADRGRASDLAWVEVLEGVERMFRCGQDTRRRRPGFRPDRGLPGHRRPSASMSRCLPQVDHEPAHGTWICGVGAQFDSRQVADAKRGGSRDPPLFLATDQLRSVVHIAHPTHAATTRHGGSLLLRLLRDHRLGGHQQTGY